MDIIKEIFTTDNIEGDKKFIDEFVQGLGKDEKIILKKLAQELMEEQNIHKDYVKVMYRNAFKYIACRRMYKKEIQTYTQKSILGDYIDVDTERWITLKRR